MSTGRTIGFVICLVLSWSGLHGQSLSRMEKKGDKAYDKYAFINARDYYLKVANESEPPSDELLEKLGDSYYYTADYRNAAHWYKQLYDKGTAIEPEYLYRYALSLKSTGDYRYSDKVMEEFYEAKGGDYRARLFNDNRNYLKEIDLQSGKFKMEKAAFNSPLSDFAPAIYKGGVVFASNRTRPQMEKNVHVWNKQPFLDLYYMERDTAMGKEKVRLFGKNINTKYHESTAIFTKDTQTVYFTRNNYYQGQYGEDREGVNRLKLFKGTKTGDGHWEVTELPFNSDSYSVAHPALAPDEKTLYFSSDMPGGYGQSDLYRVAITGTGYGTPKSLGETINTEGRETFPFVDSEGRLFFSSDGQVGLGGLDVFVAELTDGGLAGPAFNVGKPINSPQDDITFVLGEDGKKGYMASNRGNDPGNDDIYRLTATGELFTSCFQLLKGQVLDNKTMEPIAGTSVVLLGADNEPLETVYTDGMGNFSFERRLQCNQSYAVRASKEHYTTLEKTVATGNLPSEMIETELLLVKGDFVAGTDLGKVLELEPIYFDFDKSDIRPDAAAELEKVIEAMQTFPGLKIDVRSHTDSRAGRAYNLALSERRNRATIDYIIGKGGIAPERLSGRGYGEGRPVNCCTDGVPCSAIEHQLNRRSEFVILEK